MPDGDGWKETFQFFIKELEEVYLPQLKDFWDLVLPVSPLGGKPEEDIEEVPQPVPVPSPPPGPPRPPLPEIPGTERFQPISPMLPVAGEPTWVPPYDPPDLGPISPDRTPFPPWDPLLPYGYDAGTPTPLQLEPGPPMPWWEGLFPEHSFPWPWWREMPGEIFSFDTHIAQAPPVDLERKA